MTKPKDDDVKRWTFEQIQDNHEIKVRDLIGPWVEAADHDRKVAELEAKIELKCIPDLKVALELGRQALELSILESELFIARKVIEKLREQRDYWIDHGGWNPEFCVIKKREMDIEINVEISNLKNREIENAVEKRL